MSKKRKHIKRTSTSAAMVVGVAWYRPEQWALLREIAADSDKLDKTYEEWKSAAEKGMRKLKEEGVLAEKVDMNADELLRWCQKRSCSVDASARSEYVAEKLMELHQGAS